MASDLREAVKRALREPQYWEVTECLETRTQYVPVPSELIPREEVHATIVALRHEYALALEELPPDEAFADACNIVLKNGRAEAFLELNDRATLVQDMYSAALMHFAEEKQAPALIRLEMRECVGPEIVEPGITAGVAMLNKAAPCIGTPLSEQEFAWLASFLFSDAVAAVPTAIEAEQMSTETYLQLAARAAELAAGALQHLRHETAPDTIATRINGAAMKRALEALRANEARLEDVDEADRGLQDPNRHADH